MITIEFLTVLIQVSATLGAISIALTALMPYIIRFSRERMRREHQLVGEKELDEKRRLLVYQDILEQYEKKFHRIRKGVISGAFSVFFFLACCMASTFLLFIGECHYYEGVTYLTAPVSFSFLNAHLVTDLVSNAEKILVPFLFLAFSCLFISIWYFYSVASVFFLIPPSKSRIEKCIVWFKCQIRNLAALCYHCINLLVLNTAKFLDLKSCYLRTKISLEGGKRLGHRNDIVETSNTLFDLFFVKDRETILLVRTCQSLNDPKLIEESGLLFDRMALSYSNLKLIMRSIQPPLVPEELTRVWYEVKKYETESRTIRLENAILLMVSFEQFNKNEMEYICNKVEPEAPDFIKQKAPKIFSFQEIAQEKDILPRLFE